MAVKVSRSRAFFRTAWIGSAVAALLTILIVSRYDRPKISAPTDHIAPWSMQPLKQVYFIEINDNVRITEHIPLEFHSVNDESLIHLPLLRWCIIFVHILTGAFFSTPTIKALLVSLAWFYSAFLIKQLATHIASKNNARRTLGLWIAAPCVGIPSIFLGNCDYFFMMFAFAALVAQQEKQKNFLQIMTTLGFLAHPFLWPILLYINLRSWRMWRYRPWRIVASVIPLVAYFGVLIATTNQNILSILASLTHTQFIKNSVYYGPFHGWIDAFRTGHITDYANLVMSLFFVIIATTTLGSWYKKRLWAPCLALNAPYVIVAIMVSAEDLFWTTRWGSLILVSASMQYHLGKNPIIHKLLHAAIGLGCLSQVLWVAYVIG